MGNIRHLRNMILLGTVVLLQACATASAVPDPHKQHAAIERYNRCVVRFNTTATQFCDGHRRDVLATYPLYMQTHIGILLTRKTNEINAKRIVHSSTELDYVAERLRSFTAADETGITDL